MLLRVYWILVLGNPLILQIIPSTKFLFEIQKTSNLFCLVQNGPVVIWVAYIGLKGSSRGSLSSEMSLSRPFGLKVQKASEKPLSLPKDPLELPLRPIQATQMTTGPFWTRQKRFEVFWTSNRNLATWKPFSIEGTQQLTKPLKQQCTLLG